VHHQVQQAGNVGLEGSAFRLDVGSGGHGRQWSPAFSNVFQMARKPNQFKIIKWRPVLRGVMSRTVSASYWFLIVFFKL
jgi:hypothetical protein